MFPNAPIAVITKPKVGEAHMHNTWITVILRHTDMEKGRNPHVKQI